MLLMIHGWSDTSRSFRHLGNTLVSEGVVDSVKHVRLGDYVSLDDDITFDDLADALEKAWQDEALPTRPRSVDVLIHSTGALVVRHWMTRYHKAATNPIICHKTACVTASQRQAVAILTTSNYLTAPKHAGTTRFSRHGREGTSFYEGVAVVKPPAAAVVA